MRKTALILVGILLVAACGDDGAFTSSTAAPSSTAASSTTGAPASTVTETTPATQPAETTQATQPPETTATTEDSWTAADALDSFFTVAEDLDGRIRNAAGVFNAGLDTDAVTIDAGVQPVLDALDATPLRYMIPAGMSPGLEVAVLAVFADLDSRISALQGGWRSIEYSENLDWAYDCLSYGGDSADRFPTDLQRARDLAADEAAPDAPDDSPEAGVLMVRLEAIQSMNWGCDSCGGVQYDAAIPVDWEGRTLMGGVGFEASFEESRWEILIYAC